MYIAAKVAARYASSRLRFEVEHTRGQIWVGLSSKTEDVGFIILGPLGGYRLRDDCRANVEALQAETDIDEVYRVVDVEIEPDWQGKGWGKKLYERALKEAAPAIVVTGGCTGMGSTADALRVWQSLAKRYPTRGSGDALVIAVK